MKIPSIAIKKIAIFRALHLGDLLCTIPAFKALKIAYPSSKIYLIGLPNSAPLCNRFNKYIDGLIVFPGYTGLPEQEYSQSEIDSFINRMQKEKFDLIIQMHGNGTIVNSLCASFKPTHLAGFYPPEEEHTNSNLFLLYPNFGHESSRHLLLIKHLGIKIESKKMEFPITQRDEIEFKNLQLFDSSKPYICIHPGSRDASRQWPISNFSSIGDFVRQRGYEVIITGTQNEHSLAEKVAKTMKYSSSNFAGRTSLGSLAVLLKNSRGLISNCTGISHIAAAIETPSVIISMDGEPERWGPENKDIHQTVDWLKDQQYGKVLMAVERMLPLIQQFS